MNKINTLGKILILAAVIVVVIVLIMVYGGAGSSGGTPAGSGQGSGQQTSTQQNQPSQAAVNATNEPPTSSPKSTPPIQKSPQEPQPAPSKSGSGVVLHLITPVAGDTLTVGTQNPISWDKPGGISGQIVLLSASTHVQVGVILPQVGPDQTSYTWNTRDILLSRTSPSKQDVLPGTYMVELLYDGNGVLPVTSGVFTVAQ